MDPTGYIVFTKGLRGVLIFREESYDRGKAQLVAPQWNQTSSFWSSTFGKK